MTVKRETVILIVKDKYPDGLPSGAKRIALIRAIDRCDRCELEEIFGHQITKAYVQKLKREHIIKAKKQAFNAWDYGTAW